MNSFRSLIVSSALVCAASVGFCAAPSSGYVDFGALPPGKGDFVEVNLQSGLLKLAARLAKLQDPAAAELLGSLERVRVNVIGLDQGNAENITERVAKIRSKLADQGWEQIVTVKQHNEGAQDVAIFLKHGEGEAIAGLVITVVDGAKQAVLVNVVGNIKPEQIELLARHLNIDGLKDVAVAKQA
ncbi:DUF4252 domain-containing protein [Horticoccus luteus]|uniref:DUF4252 domain-containing protein n=1 Tax=Horticoccus luteus TaxID=2862869 RepID=A0A8F9TSU2_9BACT|nr:DUF4252 domain-containing protein [Horticoccus luteus]QYM77653.1 DUF4252 domain-containing protein [Horticoccus luteus]